MDEQRFRARLAALDRANLALNFAGALYGGDAADVTSAVLEVATALEEWLMRPAPAGPTVTAEDHGEHDAETVADRLSYERCDTIWRNGDGQLHRCQYPPDHEPSRCRCSCGRAVPAR